MQNKTRLTPFLALSLLTAGALFATEINVQMPEAASAPAPAGDAKTYYHAIPSTPAVGQSLKVVESNDDTDYIVKAFKMKNPGIVYEIRAILERTVQKEGGKMKSIVNKVNGDEYLVVTCPDFQMPYIEAVVKELDEVGTKFAGGGTERYTYECKNRLGSDLKEFLEKTLTSGYGECIIDDAVGKIHVNDAPSSVNTVKRFLPLFDVAPSQVRIECQIIEVENSDDFNFGLALEAWKNALPESVDMTIDWDKKNNGNNGSPDGWARTIAQNIQLSGMRPKAMANFVNYLVRKGDAKVLSSPVAVALNGQTTVLESTDNVNYKGYNGDPNQLLDCQAQSGVILKIRPIIGTESISLDVKAEVKSVVGWTTGGLPIINTRNTEATVGVKDGEQMTVSGLRREYITKSDERVPLLGSLPLLGYFFRHEIDVKKNSEIIIMLTPYQVTRNRDREEQMVKDFEKQFEEELSRTEMDKFVDRVIYNEK